jgi:NAD-dependent deacetylase
MNDPHADVPSLDPAALAAAARHLRAAQHVVILTGAGISAESDIPTFRDTMDALWREFDPQTLATPEAFARDPETVTRWYDHRRVRCLQAEPNPGHLALARLERTMGERGGQCTILTQNVDRLHQRAGSVDVVELHGTIMAWRCTRTGRPVPLGDDPITEFPPPSPHAAGALLRPDVVWFGEMLPEAALDRAERVMQTCDCFLSVGTSSVVYPAAGFIDAALAAGAPVIEVNPGDTAASERVTHRLVAPGGVALPALLDAAFGGAD